MGRPREQLGQDFGRRVEPHTPALLRYARRMLFRPGDAPDVLQAALTRALQAHHRFDPESSFKAWIYRFTTLEAFNHNRRTARDSALGDASEAVPQDEPLDIDLELAYEEVLADPARLMTRLETPLATALESLPAPMRAAFLLRTLAELGCSEIADVLDAPKGTIVAWLYRARVRLRRELADYARQRGWRSEVG